ncbi:hypothetical protein [Noviherbaspirillum sp.]
MKPDSRTRRQAAYFVNNIATFFAQQSCRNLTVIPTARQTAFD